MRDHSRLKTKYFKINFLKVPFPTTNTMPGMWYIKALRNQSNASLFPKFYKYSYVGRYIRRKLWLYPCRTFPQAWVEWRFCFHPFLIPFPAIHRPHLCQSRGVSWSVSGFFKIPPSPGKSQHEQNTSKDASAAVSRQSRRVVLKHGGLPANGSAVVIMTAIGNCRCLFQSL